MMPVKIDNRILQLCSVVLVVIGSLGVIEQIKIGFSPHLQSSPEPDIIQTKGQPSELQGAFAVDSVDKFVFQRDGKDAFSLLLTRYQDSEHLPRSAILYPKTKQSNHLINNPPEVRQEIWDLAAKSISTHTSATDLMLSWWDDGQRIHFLTGRNSWLSNPGDETFNNPLWKKLAYQFSLAVGNDKGKLTKMAQWLTMDSDKALHEIRSAFGKSQPVYLLVTNDLLMRINELADYGGTPLSFRTLSLAANENLHGDIAAIKNWALQEGNGNYLIQKEGLRYRAWTPSKTSTSTENTLLVRLLPFVSSLKQLPSGVHLVYQSHWGGYLSIYKIL